MSYWLMKSEPSEFGIDDLAQRPGARDTWNGVRNFQARNMLRDDMQPGDLALFYHSSCPEPGVAGIIRITSRGHADACAFDPGSDHYDPDSSPDSPRWYAVDVEFVRKFSRLIPLAELRAQSGLKNLALLRRGNRLSVMPVSAAEWKRIISLEKG
jgi:predicted RNA-binding protein with PUA-like domain